MTTELTNRKDYRNQIYADLAAVLVGVGLPCVAGFNGQFAQFNGATPAFVVYSRGSNRGTFQTYGLREDSRIFIGVDVLVPYINERSPGWDEQKAEDALDDIEKIISTWVLSNRDRKTGAVLWQDLAFINQAGFGSFTDSIAPRLMAGVEYRRERFTLALKVTQYTN